MTFEILHWGVALVPVLVLLAIFTWLDSFRLMSLSEIFFLLVAGGIAAIVCWPISGRMLDTLPIGFNFYSRFVAPWIEELVKGLVIVMLFRANRIGYKLDAVISGFAIGAGFSVVENIIYLVRFPDYGTGTWLVRGLGTAVMHGTTLAILAASAHEFAERENRGAAGQFDFRLWWFVPGYVAAVAIHTLFNQFPGQPMIAMMGAILIAPALLIAVLNFGTGEAQQWLAAEYVAHRAQYRALDDGTWPPGPTTPRIAALADRLGETAAASIRDYWRIQAWLVAEAEEALIEEAEGDVSLDIAKVRSAFADLQRLKRELGPSTFAALKLLLPFSRNDYWELSELRQRVKPN